MFQHRINKPPRCCLILYCCSPCSDCCRYFSYSLRYSLLLRKTTKCHDFLTMWVSFLHQCICAVACSVCQLFCVSLSESRFSQWHFSNCGSVQCIFLELLKPLLLYLITMFSSTSYHLLLGIRQVLRVGGEGSLSPFYRPGDRGVAFGSNFPKTRRRTCKREGPTSLQLTFYSFAFVFSFDITTCSTVPSQQHYGEWSQQSQVLLR